MLYTVTSGYISGNMTVIGAVYSDKRLWKEGNIFILNLAIADLCVTGMVNLNLLIMSTMHSRTLFCSLAVVK